MDELPECTLGVADVCRWTARLRRFGNLRVAVQLRKSRFYEFPLVASLILDMLLRLLTRISSLRLRRSLPTVRMFDKVVYTLAAELTRHLV